MKKKIIKILLYITFFSSTFWNIYASNELLDSLAWSDSREISLWANNLYDLSINIANSLITLFFSIAIIYFFIIIIKLLINSNSEEESKNFKKWFIWISIGLLVMQMARVFVNSIYNINYKNQNEWITNLANNLLENIIKPFTNLLEMWASFFFIMIAIYTFFKFISSNWNNDTLKNGKNTILYSIIWFILVKVSSTLIKAIYWECTTTSSLTRITCGREPNLEWISWIISSIINWMNSFIWIWIVILIIYSWLQIIFSQWDEEKLNNWKKWLLFIVIGIWILMMNYLIVTFFLNIN